MSDMHIQHGLSFACLLRNCIPSYIPCQFTRHKDQLKILSLFLIMVFFGLHDYGICTHSFFCDSPPFSLDGSTESIF